MAQTPQALELLDWLLAHDTICSGHHVEICVVDLGAAMVKRLTQREIADYRLQLLQAQAGLCALCGEPIMPGSAVLDHDHVTGHIRGVLHRGCNALEGQIVNSLPRNQISESQLQEIFQRWRTYHMQQYAELHPTHRTPEERAALRRRRAQQRAAARRKTQK